MSTSLNSISDALNLIDTKKQNLKNAFDNLLPLTSLLSPSSSLSWAHIDSHFTSIQHSLTQRFHNLQQNPQSNSTISPSSPNKNENSVIKKKSLPLVKPRRELVTLCENMDGKGLMKYVFENFRKDCGFEDEVLSALNCAVDPPGIVLDSLGGFFGVEGMKLARIRRCGLLFLVKLGDLGVEIGGGEREKAREMEIEWKRKLVEEDHSDSVGALAYLHLVFTFGLVGEISMDDVVEFCARAASGKDFCDVIGVMGLVDKVPDIIQKLKDRGKYVLAVKCVMEFNLADKIPPVPILKACVDDSEKLAKRILQDGKPPVEAISREIHKLRSVVKAVQKYNLESEYPIAGVEQRIEQLEQQKLDKKRPAAYTLAARSQPQPQQHQQQKKNIKSQEQRQHIGNKHPRVSVPVAPAALQQNVGSANLALHQYQQPLIHSTGLLPKHQNSYMSSQAMPYSMVGPASTVTPYTGPSAGSYDVPGPSVSMVSSGNPSQVGSHPYSSKPNMLSGYHDGIATHSGLPHYYHSSYYPQ